MNIQMSILKALGIILVVMGHKGVKFSWFPIYSYHVALFFFASGYFYKRDYDNKKLLFLKKKTCSLLIPYFIYNFIYLTVSLVIYINLNILIGSSFTLYNFFIEPFITGHQYHLFLAAWFVPQLFIIQIVFNNFHPIINRYLPNNFLKLLIFLPLAIVAIYFSQKGYNQSFYLLLTRSCVGMFFYYLGFMFKENIERTNIYRTEVLLIVIILQLTALSISSDVNFIIVFADYRGHLVLPIITGITGIYLCLFLSRIVSSSIKSNDLLVKIGNNSFHIMANHLFVFFVINFIAVKLSGSDIRSLQGIWYSYFEYKYWIIYAVGGVLIPLFMSLFIKKMVVKLKVYETWKGLWSPDAKVVQPDIVPDPE